MNVVLISKTDWANVGYEMQEALRSVGVKAISVQKKPHHFKYPNKSHVYRNAAELNTYAKNANIIQFMHSENTSLEPVAFTSGKGIAVFHGGSAYRRSPSKMNRFWNPRAQAALIQTGDLLGRGDPLAKNAIWFLPPINTEGLQPHYDRAFGNKRLIAHCPSMVSRKGSVEFEAVMKKLSKDPQLKDKFAYKHAPRWTNWEQNIAQMKKCDIYFDACKPRLGKNMVYGEWGIAALEACSLGKAVVSHFLSVDQYKKEFGIECPIQHANNFDQVEKQIRRFILMPDAEFMALRKRTRSWVVNNHSRKVIGQKLVNIYNKHLTWKGK